MVPPRSDRISRVPPYSRTKCLSTHTGLSPTMARLSRRFWFLTFGHWASPRSLATTNGVSVDVLSSSYLDVSVRWVCFVHLCIQCTMTLTGRVSPFRYLRIKGCSQPPRSFSQGATSFIASQSPRHPPNALLRLIEESSRTGASPVNTIPPVSQLIFGYTKQSIY